MTTTSLLPGPMPDAMTRVQRHDATRPDSAADKAFEQFEGVFISLMLKEMRKTVGEGHFAGDSSDTLGGLFDMTLGEELSRSGGLGITAALARYQQQTGDTPLVTGETP